MLPRIAVTSGEPAGIGPELCLRLAGYDGPGQPVILAEGLVRLGLAESALADREAFVANFTRLAEVEERFAAYGAAALSAATRLERRNRSMVRLRWSRSSGATSSASERS